MVIWASFGGGLFGAGSAGRSGAGRRASVPAAQATDGADGAWPASRLQRCRHGPTWRAGPAAARRDGLVPDRPAHRAHRRPSDRVRRGAGPGCRRAAGRPRAFALVLTSPLQRASRTAALAGLSGAQTEPDLVEWDYGGYEGLTSAEIHEQGRPGWRIFDDGVVPGTAPGSTPGETLEQVAARAGRVLDRVRPVLETGDVALVSHGHLLADPDHGLDAAPAGPGRSAGPRSRLGQRARHRPRLRRHPVLEPAGPGCRPRRIACASCRTCSPVRPTTRSAARAVSPRTATSPAARARGPRWRSGCGRAAWRRSSGSSTCSPRERPCAGWSRVPAGGPAPRR